MHMSNYPSLITRTVMCPQCRASATLSYASFKGLPGQSFEHHFVYLCPNLCSLPQQELAALVEGRT